jgi:hypothetical protein
MNTILVIFDLTWNLTVLLFAFTATAAFAVEVVRWLIRG